MPNLQFSVLMATYKGDESDGLLRALNSVIEQTVQPEEIVIVADGQLTSQLKNVLDQVETDYPNLITRTSLPTNQGLGAALRHGVKVCSNEWIARIDADDIAVEDRFERQMEYLEAHPDTDALGGYIGEFSEDPEQIEATREVPTKQDELHSSARFRSPMNHPTVIFRRSAVLDVGNYRPLRSMQDYDLWMRMLAADYTLSNIPTVLVKCEAGEELFRRRGGLKYAKTETKLQYEFLRLGVISVPIFFLNLSARIPIRLAPNPLRGLIYRSFLRHY